MNGITHLYLIDGYGFLFRAYHAIRPLSAPDGTPVNAIYGLTSMLIKTIKRIMTNEPSAAIVMVLDSGRENFRHQLYPAYKANRPEAPEDLIPQFALAREASAALSLHIAELVGFEADDLIASYTKEAKKRGVKTTIISSDKDLMQLISDGVEMYDGMKDKEIGEKEVFEKFGVRPDQVLDVLALMGDSSDNIPGVPSIGPKTAAELLNKFGTLEELLKRTAEIPQQKRREAIEINKEQAILSKKLAALSEDAPLPFALEDLKIHQPDKQIAAEFLSRMGFKSLISRLDENGVSTIPISKPAQSNMFDAPDTSTPAPEEVKFKEIDNLSEVAVLTEKTGLLAVLISEDKTKSAFATGGQNFIADFGVINSSEFKNILSNLSIKIITWDYKHFVHYTGVKAQAFEDVMLITYLLNGSPKSLKDFLEKAGVDGSNLCNAASYLFLFYQQNINKIFKAKMVRVYEALEKPLENILYKMEARGVLVSPEILNSLSAEFAVEIAKLEKEIHALAGQEFNVASPKQLGEILFEKMQLPGGKKSAKSGAYGTDVDVLEALSADGHEIAGKVLEHRSLSKLKSTYTDSLVKEISPNTGRIHTHFGMAVASTGRLSSTNPNLQNIPIRTKEGRRIRSAFIANKGNVLISADYSQIELRLLAHIADVPNLRSAFLDGRDIHAQTASDIFGVKLEEVNSDIRRQAKTVNFGIIYGQSAHGLAQQLGISRTEAAGIIEAYFKQYPGIRAYMEEAKNEARKYGFVTTIYGRRCYVPEINSKNGAMRAFSERAAINAPLQGSAADIIKHAMVRIDIEMPEANMILQVHDELLFEEKEADAVKISTKVKNIMESVCQLNVPVLVDAKFAHNWDEAH